MNIFNVPRHIDFMKLKIWFDPISFKPFTNLMILCLFLPLNCVLTEPIPEFNISMKIRRLKRVDYKAILTKLQGMTFNRMQQYKDLDCGTSNLSEH